MIDKEKIAKEAVATIEFMMAAAKENPERTVVISHGYFRIGDFADAVNDIALREVLGATTKADTVLIQILAYCARVY